METVKSVIAFLNDAHLVRQFQTFCGLDRVPSVSTAAAAAVDSAPSSTISDRRKSKSFLKGDKGIDSLFSAVDRDSRFISQDELVNRHIQHLKEHEGGSLSRDGPSYRADGPSHREGAGGSPQETPPSTGRIVPRSSPLAALIASQDNARATREEEKTRVESSPDFIIHSRVLYYLFRFGSSLGYEAFYATFFPIWTWNIDGAVCRRVVTMWVITMYIGQVLKDILKLPRPSPKIVIQMEQKYVSEYGMPSTHAMIGFSVPFSLLYFCMERYEFPFAVGLVVCSTWCLLICLSRLYLGMHSILDILGGLILVIALFALFLPLADVIDNFQLTSPIAPLVMIVAFLLPCVYYPQTLGGEVGTGQWGPTWADTATILAAGFGIFLGNFFNFQLGLIQAPPITGHGLSLPPPYPIIWPSRGEIIKSVFRIISDPNEVKGKNLVKFELPVKFFTYAAIGMSATFFIPALFRGLNIARDTMYTEV